MGVCNVCGVESRHFGRVKNYLCSLECVREFFKVGCKVDNVGKVSKDVEIEVNWGSFFSGTFRSLAEVLLAQMLMSLGVVFEYERYMLKAGDVVYVPDFCCYWGNGKVFLEVKANNENNKKKILFFIKKGVPLYVVNVKRE